MPFDRSMELLFFRQLLTPNYVQLAMLVGLILVVIYRPERIYIRAMYCLSFILLALSILVGPVATAFITAMTTATGGGMGRPNNPSEIALLYSMLQIVEPILVALSICFGLFSLVPWRRPAGGLGPAQHPMDP